MFECLDYFSADEMIIRFQKNHTDKRRIICNNEYVGFQYDAFYDNGLCYHFYFRDDSAPTEYTETGLALLHYRSMLLFDTCQCCRIDSVYKKTSSSAQSPTLKRLRYTKTQRGASNFFK